MYEINTTPLIITIPYPKKVIGIRYVGKRKIGLEFTNLSRYLFCEHHSITADNIKQADLIKDKGAGYIINMQIYFAAVAYNMRNRVKEDYDLTEFMRALALCNESQTKAILDAYKVAFDIPEVKKKVKIPAHGRTVTH